MSRSLGVGGRLLSSLLSAYLDIWPDTHCKEGKDENSEKTKEKDDSEKKETDVGEKAANGKAYSGRKHEAQPKRENNVGQHDLCETPGSGKIQCGR